MAVDLKRCSGCNEKEFTGPFESWVVILYRFGLVLIVYTALSTTSLISSRMQ